MTVEQQQQQRDDDPEQPQQQQQQQSPSSSRFTIVEVIDVLTSFRRDHARLKHYRVSLSVIRFLSILNFVYTILGVTFLVLALCSDWTPEFNDAQRSQFYKIGTINRALVYTSGLLVHRLISPPGPSRFFGLIKRLGLLSGGDLCSLIY